MLLFLRGLRISEHSPALKFKGASLPREQIYYITLGADNGVFNISDSGSVPPRIPDWFTEATPPGDLDGVRAQLMIGGPAATPDSVGSRVKKGIQTPGGLPDGIMNTPMSELTDPRRPTPSPTWTERSAVEETVN